MYRHNNVSITTAIPPSLGNTVKPLRRGHFRGYIMDFFLNFPCREVINPSSEGSLKDRFDCNGAINLL